MISFDDEDGGTAIGRAARARLDWLMAKFSEPWSDEFRSAILFLSGIALGVLICTAGRQ